MKKKEEKISLKRFDSNVINLKDQKTIKAGRTTSTGFSVTAAARIETEHECITETDL